MHTRFSMTVGLLGGCLLLVACPNDDGNNDSGESPQLDAAQTSLDGSQDLGAQETGIDGAVGCCPTGYLLYSCTLRGGETGLACHNPAMGCASSSSCGSGCDPQVSGRCACVETQLCVTGDHFDRDLCKCVPNADASTNTDAGKDAACIENVLCIRGDHFDTTLCRCVPDMDGGGRG